jgi:hypothetical protein
MFIHRSSPASQPKAKELSLIVSSPTDATVGDKTAVALTNILWHHFPS